MPKKRNIKAERSAPDDGPVAPQDRTGAVLYLCAALALLGCGAYIVYAGGLTAWKEFLVAMIIAAYLFMESSGRFNKSMMERMGRKLALPLYSCAAMGLLAYGVYGLAAGRMRLLIPGKFSSTGGIYLHGPASWALFLSYLMFSAYLALNAVSIIYVNVDLEGKSDKISRGALILGVLMYAVAVVLARRLQLH